MFQKQFSTDVLKKTPQTSKVESFASRYYSLHKKKRSFPLRISSVNVTKIRSFLSAILHFIKITIILHFIKITMTEYHLLH